MKCPSCGTRLSKGATFCHICYTVVGAPPAPPTASSATSTAASPLSVARPVPATAIAPGPPRAAHRPRTAHLVGIGGLSAALILVALLLTRPWESGAAPGGAGVIPAIPPVQGDGGVGRWQLGDARVSVAQTPGCDEGPCPGTMAVRFSDGSTSSVDDEATISEIGQVDPTHYLAAAGFCYMNCTLRVYAIDTAVRSVTTILDRAQPDATGKPSYFPMSQGVCGFTLTYRGATYTVRIIPDKTSSFVTWRLYLGDKACPSQSYNAGSSGAAGGASVVPPSPQSTAMAQATQGVAAPQDTQAPTAVAEARGPSPAQGAKRRAASGAALGAGALVRIGGGTQIGNLESMTVDAAGNVYVGGKAIIKRIDRRTGAITTVAGTGTAGYSGEGGLATQARIDTLNAPRMAVDRAGDLYFVDQGNNRIRRVDARTGILTTVAGTGGKPVNDLPTGIAATQAPLAVTDAGVFLAVDAQGNVFFAQALSTSPGLYEVEARTGLLRLAATLPPSADGQTRVITAMALDHAGTVYLVDDTSRIHKQRLFSGKDTVVAGDGRLASAGSLTAEGTGEPATRLTLGPWYYLGVATDAAGTLFFGDMACQCVRAIAPGTDRVISVRAATRLWRARGSPLYDMTFDGAGTLYFVNSRGGMSSIYGIMGVGRAARVG